MAEVKFNPSLFLNVSEIKSFDQKDSEIGIGAASWSWKSWSKASSLTFSLQVRQERTVEYLTMQYPKHLFYWQSDSNNMQTHVYSFIEIRKVLKIKMHTRNMFRANLLILFGIIIR